jgi:hypothetical protein
MIYDVVDQLVARLIECPKQVINMKLISYLFDKISTNKFTFTLTSQNEVISIKYSSPDIIPVRNVPLVLIKMYYSSRFPNSSSS